MFTITNKNIIKEILNIVGENVKCSKIVLTETSKDKDIVCVYSDSYPYGYKDIEVFVHFYEITDDTITISIYTTDTHELVLKLN